MARNTKKKAPLLWSEVEITDVAAEGKAIARIDDLVVFVPFAAPGDVVDLQCTRKKKSFAEAKVTKFHKLSPFRTEPFCSHFGTCGGCKWQHLAYSEQLRYKQEEVESNLRRIGKVELPEFEPILGSDKTKYYRNKLEFTFSNKRWRTYEEIGSETQFTNPDALGFHIPGCFDKVLDVDNCYLQTELSDEIRLEVRRFCLENEYPFFDLRNQEGLMRTLMIRTTSTGELMVIVIFACEDQERRIALMEHLAERFPQITALMYCINEKRNDTIGDQEIVVFKGSEAIYEEMEGLKFKIGPKSFYQTNSDQAYELYKITREFAGLTGEENVYDLYTGTGTIANFVAHQAKAVVGVEYVPEAIEDAIFNSQNNGITNTTFYAGDMKDILNEEFIEKHGKPDVIITDPPRAGMHEDVVNTILFAAPKRIVYVSCNSATQARDLALLDVDYKVTRVRPVDMFPHTHHVENVVLLERR
ncbi:MAG: 23S rRNA (uracil(1939)-C(5))-methyltransferase RlmD [Bacteroidales bacterium]